MTRGLHIALNRYVERLLAAILGLLSLVLLVLTLLWRDRGAPEDAGLTAPPAEIVPGEGVTVTWFGVTTLLFDDGVTQILIDGFISRPTLYDLLLERPVASDAARINWFLNHYRVRNLAAIVPVHSHYDHAMDVGALANRTHALVLGSASTAEIAFGSGVPRDQVLVAEPGRDYRFGDFTVRLLQSRHAPVGWNGDVPLPGDIREPLIPPAPVTAYKEGTSYAVLVSHPAGEALVQGSAGIQPGALDRLSVDTVFLGVGMLESLGREYMQRYWESAVTATGAKTVIPVHFDDYTQPFGQVRLAPRMLDDFTVTARILKDLRRRWDGDTQIYLPAFGVPMPLLPRKAPET